MSPINYPKLTRVPPNMYPKRWNYHGLVIPISTTRPASLLQKHTGNTCQKPAVPDPQLRNSLPEHLPRYSSQSCLFAG